MTKEVDFIDLNQWVMEGTALVRNLTNDHLLSRLQKMERRPLRFLGKFSEKSRQADERIVRVMDKRINQIKERTKSNYG